MKNEKIVELWAAKLATTLRKNTFLAEMLRPKLTKWWACGGCNLYYRKPQPTVQKRTELSTVKIHRL